MTREEIITKKFPHSVFGYDIYAVDRFLDEVIYEIDRLNAEIRRLKKTMETKQAENEQDEFDADEGSDEKKTIYKPYEPPVW